MKTIGIWASVVAVALLGTLYLRGHSSDVAPQAVLGEGEHHDSAASDDTQSSLRALERRIRELESDRRKATAGTGAAEEDAPPVVGTEEDRESPVTNDQEVAEAVQAQQQTIASHDAEGRDNVWANEMERTVGVQLRDVLSKAGLQVNEFDCRTTSCLLKVGGAFESVMSNLPNAMMSTSPGDCAFSWALPPPSAGEDVSHYEGVASLDCTQMRVNGT